MDAGTDHVHQWVLPPSDSRAVKWRCSECGKVKKVFSGRRSKSMDSRVPVHSGHAAGTLVQALREEGVA